MSIINPIVATTELRRWPFQRRPVAPTGTELVFKKANGELLYRAGAMLASDVTLRGLREMYTVDVRSHSASFSAKLPSSNIALEFQVAVNYTWRVTSPPAVVREGVNNAPADCQALLIQRMRPICRAIAESEETRAELELNVALSAALPLTFADRGLTITAVTVEVRSDAEVLGLGREKYTQTGTLALHQERVTFFQDIITSGSVYANILAHDPSKAEAAGEFIERQLESDRRATIEAMKVLIEGRMIAAGDADAAVVAVVDRFRRIVTEPTPTTAALTGERREAILPGQATTPAPDATPGAGDRA